MDPEISYRQGLEQARRAFQRRDFTAAENDCQRLLAQRGEAVELWELRALIHSERGELIAAREAFQKVVALAPHSPSALNNLGEAYRRLGQLNDAAQWFQRALQAAPTMAATHFNLANVLSAQGKLREATDHYRLAVEHDPQHARAWGSLGIALTEQGDLSGAITALQKAIGLSPGRADWHAALANAWRDSEDFERALDAYRTATQLDPTLFAAHYGLGVVRQEQQQFAEAVQHFQRALELQPHDLAALRNCALSLETWGRTEQARGVYGRAQQLTPADEVLRLHSDTLCPLFPHDNEAIDAYRAEVSEVLDRYRPGQLKVPLREATVAGCHVPFAWVYQGRDDHDLKMRWAAQFAGNFPDFALPRTAAMPHLGFVVTAGHETIFLRCLSGILNQWPTQRWRVTIVCGGPASEHRLRTELHQDKFRFLSLPARFDQAVECLRQAQCDLLYYWEVATDATNYFLPFCRLARVQCTGWGWSVTTGIPRLDAYISSRALEPPDAAAHYSERLVLLPSLPTSYSRPAMPREPLSRAQLRFSDQDHIYVCAQNLLKVHPDFDAVVADILRHDPRGVAVFTAVRHPYRAELLRARWQAVIPDVADRIRICPGLPYREYMSLLATADVALDTLHYCGVNTTYDALAAGTPVVTLPGAFQRSRYTTAIYQQLDITDCVATSVEDYRRLAVRAATDHDWRNDLSQRQSAACPTLFDQRAPIAELEACFEQLLAIAE